MSLNYNFILGVVYVNGSLCKGQLHVVPIVVPKVHWFFKAESLKYIKGKNNNIKYKDSKMLL